MYRYLELNIVNITTPRQDQNSAYKIRTLDPERNQNIGN